MTKYSKKAGTESALYSALRANGLGSVIKETISPQTFQAVFAELAEEYGGELPNAFSDLVNVYEFPDVSHRRINKKGR